MFDTVALYIFINIDILYFNKNKGWRFFTYSKNNFKNRYFYKSKILRIWYFPSTNLLRIETSLPKAQHGTNSKMVFENDYPEINKKILGELSEALRNKVALPDLNQWLVSKIDFCFNTELPKNIKMEQFIDKINKITLGHYYKKTYKTGVFLYNKSCKFLIYQKKDEMLSRGEENGDVSERTIRIEIGFKKRKINNYYFEKPVKFKEIFKNFVAYDEIRKFLCKLRIDEEFLTKDNLLGQFNSRSYRRDIKANLVKFINDINIVGIEKVKELYPSSTMNKYTNIIKSMGANPYFLEGNFTSFSLLSGIRSKIYKNQLIKLIHKLRINKKVFWNSMRILLNARNTSFSLIRKDNFYFNYISNITYYTNLHDCGFLITFKSISMSSGSYKLEPS